MDTVLCWKSNKLLTARRFTSCEIHGSRARRRFIESALEIAVLFANHHLTASNPMLEVSLYIDRLMFGLVCNILVQQVLSLSLFRNRYSMSYNMQHWLIRCQVQPEWVMQVCTLRSLATLSRVELPYRVAYIRSSILFLDLFLNLLLY